MLSTTIIKRKGRAEDFNLQAQERKIGQRIFSLKAQES